MTISVIKGSDNVNYNLRDDVHTWGGRNLMLRTDYGTFGNSSHFNGSGMTFAGDRVTVPYAKEIYHKDYVKNVIGLIPNGSIVTCSIYVYQATATGGNHRVYMSPITNTSGSVNWVNIKSIPSGTTGLVVWQYTLTADAYGFVLDLDTRNDTSGQIIFGRAKIELGNKFTDWSPAPEDFATVVGTELNLLS